MSQIATICNLAVSDVRHEWRMSLCMILAVAAIATPLLLFFGLKYGVVETLRARLLANPSTMEILPLSEKRLTKAWFDTKEEDPRIAFVVAHTRRLAAQAAFLKKPNSLAVFLDLFPTKAGDPVLVRANVALPKRGECVLSFKAQAKLNAKIGDTLICRVSRDRGQVQAERPIKVVAILPERSGTVAVCYLPLEDLEQIEQFKDGRAVAELGWGGVDPLAYPVLHAAELYLDKPLDAVGEAMLGQNTGFAKVRSLAASSSSYHGIPKNWACYLLESVGHPADARDLAALLDRVRGKNAYLVPLCRDVALEVPTENGVQTLKLFSVSAVNRPFPDIPLPLERSHFSLKKTERIFWVAPSLLARIKSPCTVTAKAKIKDTEGDEGARTVAFQATFLPLSRVSEDMALATPSLLGQLSLLSERPLSDGVTHEQIPAFLLGRRGYTGFRMYAAALEEVSPLARELEAEGIRVSTRADRIEEVLNLDRYLDILFWIIALASLLGGVGCLISNVYANVERKRKELAVLRLIGVHGFALALFPTTEALLLTVGGVVTSLGLFHGLAFAINGFFASHMDAGEVFCRLTLAHEALAVAIAVALALVTGLAAQRRLIGIEPAESLRDE